MKKIKILLTLTLTLAALLCLTACGKEAAEKEFYTAYEISHIQVEQKSADTFVYTVESDIAPSATAKVYVARYDRIDGNSKALDYTAKDGKFVFTAEVGYDSYFIKIVDGEKTATMPMSRPQMAPALSGSGNAAVLTYNFVNGTSWSSFCDPTGKAVYRSSKPVFDESAQLVAKNINIFGVDSTTDTTASDDMPYYYVVLSAKNGIVTYISAPIMTVENAYTDLKVRLETVEGKPNLVVSGKFKVDGDVALELYSADTKLGKVTEVVGTPVTGKAGEIFEVRLDASTVVSANGAGIWYDIKLASGSGSLYELSATCADMGQTLKDKNVTFEFKEWNQILKLNYQIYDYDVESVKIETPDGVPTLVIVGTMDESLREVKIHADYEVNGKKNHLYWDNLATESGSFRFEIALTELKADGQPWYWFHIYTYKGNASVNSGSGDLARGEHLTIGQKFEYDGVTYTVKAYNDVGAQLVIEAMKQ